MDFLIVILTLCPIILFLIWSYLSFGFSKNKAKEQPAPGGGMPGMASRKLENMVKLARNLDKFGLYRIADRLM